MTWSSRFSFALESLEHQHPLKVPGKLTYLKQSNKHLWFGEAKEYQIVRTELGKALLAGGCGLCLCTESSIRKRDFPPLGEQQKWERRCGSIPGALGTSALGWEIDAFFSWVPLSRQSKCIAQHLFGSIWNPFPFTLGSNSATVSSKLCVQMPGTPGDSAGTKTSSQ